MFVWHGVELPSTQYEATQQAGFVIASEREFSLVLPRGFYAKKCGTDGDLTWATVTLNEKNVLAKFCENGSASPEYIGPVVLVK